MMIFAKMGDSNNVIFYNSCLAYPNGIPQGCVSITAEQQQEFYTKGMHHKIVEGVWTYVEPEAPTADEIKQQELDALDAEYNPQFDALTLAWATAYMSGDTKTADIRKVDKDNLIEEYNAKKGAI